LGFWLGCSIFHSDQRAFRSDPQLLAEIEWATFASWQSEYVFRFLSAETSSEQVLVRFQVLQSGTNMLVSGRFSGLGWEAFGTNGIVNAKVRNRVVSSILNDELYASLTEAKTVIEKILPQD
jgi:hypothetical protein